MTVRRTLGLWGILLFIGLALSLGSGPAAAIEFQVTNITNNAYNENYYVVDGGQVVWRGFDGTDWEIYYYDASWIPGTPPKQITENDTDDMLVQVDDGQVVWRGHDDTDWEIYYYDLSWDPANLPPGVDGNPIQLTNNSSNDTDPQIDAGQVVWRGYDGTDWEIYYYDLSWDPGTAPQQLSDNSTLDRDAQIDAGQVVWRGHDGTDWEIFLYKGWGDPIQLTDNLLDDDCPQIDGGQVVWRGDDGTDWEIFFFDASWDAGTTPQQLTDNTTSDIHPQIFDGQVVWRGHDGTDGEIYFFDLSWDPSTAPQQLSNNSTNDTNPQINSGQVVWWGDDGSDGEIYFFDLAWDPSTAPQQLTDNDVNDDSPFIEAGLVLWTGAGGPGDTTEVYLATPVLMIYSYTCYYDDGAGDSFSGTFYDYDTYAVGDQIAAFTDENGQAGYYQITAAIPAAAGVDGQVFVDQYFDSESAQAQVIASPALAGTASLGSENAYIRMADIPEYRFGGGLEADLCTYRYRYIVRYENGDEYRGEVYAEPEYGYREGLEVIRTDEHERVLRYEITEVAEESYEIDRRGRSTVLAEEGYFDAESAELQVIAADVTVGEDYLGSEDAYIRKEAIPEYRFGGGLEADLVTYAYDYTCTYEDGDEYEGTVYAEPEYGYDVDYTESFEDENGDVAVTCVIRSVDPGYDPSRAGESLVRAEAEYYDAQSLERQPIVEVLVVERTYLGGEEAYIRKRDVPEYRFGGRGRHRADLVSYAYEFTFTYENGDYYTGTVYAEPEYGYGWTFTQEVMDENGEIGVYTIDNIIAGFDDELAGQVLVNTYYDAETDTFQTLCTDNPVGIDYLGSEEAYICMEAIPEYRFGAGQECCFEADLCTYAYDFTFTYGNGDYYNGTLYAAPEEGYGTEYTQAATDENGLAGTYVITAVTSCFDVDLKGQVFVDTYYDQEKEYFFTPVHAGTAIGTGYLGTERDYILFDGMVMNRFGLGPVGSEEIHYEADVTYLQYTFNRYWEPFRSLCLNWLYYAYLVQPAYPFDDDV